MSQSKNRVQHIPAINYINNNESHIPMDKSVAIFAHGRHMTDIFDSSVNTHFRIPKGCEIFTFTPYNNTLSSNPDKLSKLFNNLRYCSDNNYLIRNKFFKDQPIHKWTDRDYFPDMLLKFNCTRILDVMGVQENTAIRHGVITFSDESPGLMILDEKPNPLHNYCNQVF